MRTQIILGLLGAGLSLGLVFQNCSKVSFAPSETQLGSEGLPTELKTGQATIDPSQSNPPLNLFFIIDNSVSMAQHQIDLGAAFTNVFQNNGQNLSNFDTKIYVFSTASTANPAFFNMVPNVNPFTATTAGGVFSFWKTESGTYGSVPYNIILAPAPIVDIEGGSLKPFLTINKKGNQTDAAYKAQLDKLSVDFKRRLEFLNPTSQTSYSPATDISSGLCSMARILKNHTSFIAPGDSAAFVIVSDDNDRLNVRNPANNQCIESIVSSDSVVDGTCGHYESTFRYSRKSTSISYAPDSRLTYTDGTTVKVRFPVNGETCNITSREGYSYTSTYTALRTAVTYTKCNANLVDGFCLNSSPNTVQILDGSYVVSGNTCVGNVSSMVTSPAPGTKFSCQPANQNGLTGVSGVDKNSNGINCSAAVVSSLSSDTKRTNIVCKIVAAARVPGSISNQQVGSCSNFCQLNAATFPDCSLTSTTPSRPPPRSFNLSGKPGLTCTSPEVINEIASRYPNQMGECETTSPLIATLIVNSALDTQTGLKLSRLSSLAGLTVRKSGAVVCTGAKDLNECVLSLGGVSPSETMNGPSVSLANWPAGSSCNSSCPSSDTRCAQGQYTTIADYIYKSFKGLCLSSKPAQANLTLPKFTFKNSIAPVANCMTKCSDTLLGACNGTGFGATDGSTVGDYVRSLGGEDSCATDGPKYKADSNVTVDETKQALACPLPTSAFFVATSPKPFAKTNATTYVAGDANQRVSDIHDFIVNQSKIVLGNAKPAVAIITHLPGDNLPGSDVGTSYINLAQAMGSNQISSIKGDYSIALQDISQFIVKTAQNSLLLPIQPDSKVVSVSVMRKGTNTWELLDQADWSFAGQTLSFNASAKIEIGDQIVYQYVE